MFCGVKCLRVVHRKNKRVRGKANKGLHQHGWMMVVVYLSFESKQQSVRTIVVVVQRFRFWQMEHYGCSWRLDGRGGGAIAVVVL